MLRTDFGGEQITHRLLWHIAKEKAEEGLKREAGWFNSSVIARVFAYHTVEAHFNYVGERIAPEIWQDERNYFRNEPYRGALGKMRKVMDLVGLPWTPEDRPLKTVLELKEIRDLIAHGKAEKLQGTALHGHEEDAPIQYRSFASWSRRRKRLPLCCRMSRNSWMLFRHGQSRCSRRKTYGLGMKR